MSVEGRPIARPLALSSPMHRPMRRFAAIAGVSLLAITIASAFLMPLVFMVATAFKDPGMLGTPGAPLYPAVPETFMWEGTEYPVYDVPLPDGSVQAWALVEPHREDALFIDPANPEAGLIQWEGRWRTLTQHWNFQLQFDNFATAWQTLNFPRMFFNTFAIAGLSTIAAVASAICVAYGFSRFRFPGRQGFFLLMLATIILPFQVTLVPTYAVYLSLGWVGTWLPLIVPHLFSNAYNVFLLRQYFLTIPQGVGRGGHDRRRRPVPDPAVRDHPAGHPGDRRGHAVPLLLGLERVLPAAGLPAGRARPAATVRRPRALQRDLLDAAHADPGRRAACDGAPGHRLLLGPARVHARRGRHRGREVKYGHFDDERREYVITQPDTPLPWINYLGNDAYFAIISNTAGGYSFYRDARLRRLTRYRYNNAPLDVGGRYLYLRDDATGEYWSPSWQPVPRDLDDYSCRHGLGYTTIASRRAGIRAETLYFVPLGQAHEVWRTRVTNERPTAARLSLVSAIEFCLWDANDDATNFQRNYSIGEVEVVDGVIYHRTEYRERRNHFAYFASSGPQAGFDTSRDAFLGPYRGWDRPLALERGAPGGSIAHGWQPIGSHWVNLELAPGETRDVVFVLGYAENPADRKFDPPGSQTLDKTRVRPTIREWLDPARVERAFDDLRADWRSRLDALQVDTGNEHVDRMVNTWNPYQCMVTFNLSRSASMFESGIGRGMGFRDSNQDLLGFVHMAPDLARQRILDIAATQLPTGGAYHQYQPLTKRGNDAVGTGFNDDPAWLDPGRRGLSPGDWRLGDPRRAPRVRQRARLRAVALRPSAACDRLHAHTARSARAAAHRPGRLERLPQPERVLRDTWRVVPDRREPVRRDRRVGLHCRVVRPGRRRPCGDRREARRRPGGRALPVGGRVDGGRGR